MSALARMFEADPTPVQILLVEDSPSDTELTAEALKASARPAELSVVEDGVEALAFLRRQGRFKDAPRPDFILLDLNLPRKDGHDVLAEIKADSDLKAIPVVVLSTSRADQDVLRAYQLNANCYITKPVGFEQFQALVRAVESFWLTAVTFPNHL